MGSGTSLRVTWTLPVVVSGAALLDFVIIRWRRKAGGYPIDMDDAQDGNIWNLLVQRNHAGGCSVAGNLRASKPGQLAMTQTS